MSPRSPHYVLLWRTEDHKYVTEFWYREKMIGQLAHKTLFQAKENMRKSGLDMRKYQIPAIREANSKFRIEINRPQKWYWMGL